MNQLSCISSFLKPTQLYNMLQQGLQYPSLSDSNFLLMFDARTKENYNESHIVTAKLAPEMNEQGVVLPFDSEVECKNNIVVYDSNTSEDNLTGPAIKYSQFLWNLGSRHKILILDGGYEVFSAFYPFLRTQQIFYLPRELDALQLFPFEIIPGELYLGKKQQANDAHTRKVLKLAAIVNCCLEPSDILNPPALLHIPGEDNCDTDLLANFPAAVEFIGRYVSSKRPVLVYSDLGISRSATVVMAFLVSKGMTLQASYEHVRMCSWSVRPNRAFISQLSLWECEKQDENITDISDPKF